MATKVYSVDVLEKRIVRILKKSKLAIEVRYISEGCNAEFSPYNFNQAICNLKSQGVIKYNEGLEGYELL